MAKQFDSQCRRFAKRPNQQFFSIANVDYSPCSGFAKAAVLIVFLPNGGHRLAACHIRIGRSPVAVVMVTLSAGLVQVDGSGQNLVVGVVGSGFSKETGPAMYIQILVETTFDDGSTQRREIARLDRTPANLATETLGLRLDEAKNLLTRLQDVLLCNQIDEVLAASRICDDCGKRCAIHDDRGRTLDTLYGRFRPFGSALRRTAAFPMAAHSV